MTKKTAIPRVWYQRLYDRADLNESFSELRGNTHALADAWRGRIRYYQGRFAQSAELLDRAQLKAAQTLRDGVLVDSLRRVVIINSFAAGTMIALDRQDEIEAAAVDRTAAPPALQDDEMSRHVYNIAQASAGAVMIAQGRSDEAVPIYQALIDDQRMEPGGVSPLCGYYTGLAICYWNIGLEEPARLNLENAGFTLSRCGRTLSRLQAATMLHGLHRFLGDSDAVAEYHSYIQTLDCPGATKVAFARSSRIMTRRSVESRQLVLV